MDNVSSTKIYPKNTTQHKVNKFMITMFWEREESAPLLIILK